MAQACLPEVAEQHLLELGQGEAGKISRQLLGPDLQQKGRHAGSPQQPPTVLK